MTATLRLSSICAICAALFVALPFSACSRYSSVSQRRVHFQSDTPDGHLLATSPQAGSAGSARVS